MRVFARPSGLERLSLEARLVYSGFCLFMLLGFASSVWFYYDDGLLAGSAAAARYYLGEGVGVEAERASAPGNLGGPALVLPGDAESVVGDAPSLRLAKPARQVMETFHFHLFSVPVCLLIVAHLFMMCALATHLKAWTVGLAYCATLAHVATPPLIRFASARWAMIMGPSAVFMTLTWLVMLTWPLVEMWVLIPRRRARD